MNDKSASKSPVKDNPNSKYDISVSQVEDGRMCESPAIVRK